MNQILNGTRHHCLTVEQAECHTAVTEQVLFNRLWWLSGLTVILLQVLASHPSSPSHRCCNTTHQIIKQTEIPLGRNSPWMCTHSSYKLDGVFHELLKNKDNDIASLVNFVLAGKLITSIFTKPLYTCYTQMKIR